MNLQTTLTFLISFLFLINLSGQDQFQAGYILLNDGTQIEGLIENRAWKNTPLYFRYKLNEEGKTNVVEVKEIKEISVPDQFKFVRRNVNAGFSGKSINDLNFEKKLELLPMSLLLEILIAGEVSLYYHKAKKSTLFFYQNAGQELEQLIYKRYKVSQGVKENNRYKQQLWLNNRCDPNAPISDLDNLKYQEKSIRQYLMDYYNCIGEKPEQVYQNNKGTKFKLNLSLSPGLSLINGNASFQGGQFTTDFEPRLLPRFGVDLEFVWPYNNGQWAILLEPNIYGFYQTAASAGTNYEIRYLNLEIAVGLRHYFFLKNGDKIFINLLLQTPYATDFNSVIIVNETIDILTRNGGGLALGVGYRKGDFGLELRSYGNRQVLVNNLTGSAFVSPLLMLVGHYKINK